MVLTEPFKQIWSAGVWDGALGLTQTTWTDWSARFGVGASVSWTVGPKHGRLVAGTMRLVSWPRVAEASQLAQRVKAKRADKDLLSSQFGQGKSHVHCGRGHH